MRILITTVFAFLFLSSSLLAQKGEKVQGYVVLNNGQKLEGSIKVGSITDNEVKVLFFSKSGSKKTYKPTDLKGYGYESIDLDDLGNEVMTWLHYETHKVDYPPKPFGPTTVFMQRELEGTITLYTYYIESRTDVKNPFRYFYYLKDDNGNLNKVEKDEFTNVAKKVFGSYSALTTRVGKKGFSYRNLDRMVRDYNYWSVNQHNSDEYRVAMKN